MNELKRWHRLVETRSPKLSPAVAHELAQHLADLYDEAIRDGQSEDAARAIVEVALADGAVQRIVDGGALNPVWSPDGELIVYAGPQVLSELPLLAVRPDGEPVELPPIRVLSRGERMRFLPDGSGLGYMQGHDPSQDFWLLDLDTKKTRQLTRLDKNATMRTFDVTPDGSRIVFDRSNENSDIVLIELPPAE